MRRLSSLAPSARTLPRGARGWRGRFFASRVRALRSQVQVVGLHLVRLRRRLSSPLLARPLCPHSPSRGARGWRGRFFTSRVRARRVAGFRLLRTRCICGPLPTPLCCAFVLRSIAILGACARSVERSTSITSRSASKLKHARGSHTLGPRLSQRASSTHENYESRQSLRPTQKTPPPPARFP